MEMVMKPGPKPKAIAERFWPKVDVRGPDDCWLWTARVRKDGYGEITVSGRTRRAHRVAYELLVGPIPEGQQLDHLCRNRACVNPSHLDPVSNRENGRRGIKGVLTTHCPQGHPYDEANTSVDADGHRHCRSCARERMRRRRAA